MRVEVKDTVSTKQPSIVLVGIGGGGSRILNDGIARIKEFRVVDRYDCLAKAIKLGSERPLAFIVDTSSDPTREGFFEHIPEKNRISLSLAARGMSRGAGGRPGRAAKAVLNDDVVENLAQNLYKPISEAQPAIVVIIHTADGGTGGGLTPEVLQHLSYALPFSTIFWVFTVLPQRSALALKGPRTVAPVIGKLLRIVQRISSRDFTQVPYKCRMAINDAVVQRETDQSYEFQHSRVAIFPMSNHHFAQCFKEYGTREIREEVLNPFPVEVLSQALYPFLKYAVTDAEEQAWMQKHWPLGPIDIPDIMAGLTPERPMVIPHLWIDPRIDDTTETTRVQNDLVSGTIRLEQIDVLHDDGIPDLFSFTGTAAGLYEFSASSLYCIPMYPKGSRYFDDIANYVSDEWFPDLSSKLKYITGREGLRIGVISHSANLKPQPIPSPREGKKLGFDNALLVTLLFGAIPDDLPIWLESTRDIIDGYKTEEMWEISGYDAMEWLRELATYLGWTDWPYKNYMEPQEGNE